MTEKFLRTTAAFPPDLFWEMKEFAAKQRLQDRQAIALLVEKGLEVKEKEDKNEKGGGDKKL